MCELTLNHTSLILTLGKAVSVYNIVLVTSKTAPIIPAPMDIITILVDTYSVLERRSSAILANIARLSTEQDPVPPTMPADDVLKCAVPEQILNPRHAEQG
jgi:hypothetical protein